MRRRNGRAAMAAGLVLAVVVLAGLAAVSSAGAAGVPIVVGGARPSMPSISGSQVVWADKYDGNWDLFRYDGVTGTTSRLTADDADQSMPSVSGGRVAYADYSTGNGDIVVRDLVTGVATRFALSGDQTNPTLSGDWLAWEDHASRSTRVGVRNLATSVTYALGSDGAAAEHPRIAGDLLVWEDHRTNSGGRLDPDVWMRTLSTGVSMAVATADVTEYYPETNGRYVVWSERASDGYHIRGYDVSTGRRLEISTGAGEQTTPAITDDKVYWTDNAPGQPLHVDTYDLTSGRRAPFYAYSSGQIAGLAASGGNSAWLEGAGTRLRVRVLLNDGLSPLARLATFNPVSSLVSSVRLAMISTGGDGIAPAIASISVAPGARRVSRTSSFAIYFSEPLDPATVSSRTVRLRDAETGDTVPATVRYSALTMAATIDPAATLASGAFTLEVDPTVTDAAGNALTEPTELTFSTASAGVDVASPTRPELNEVVVSGTGNVQATWGASTDDVGVAFYDIYRRATPMSATDYAGRELAATVPSTTLTATFAKKPDETSKSYTYYYVVVARDTVDHTSPPSTNMAPNPHGTYSATVSTSSCLRCHSVHGAGVTSPKLGARSAASCYKCHGGTPATSTYGVASTMDSQGRFNDDSAIAPGGTGMTGGTGNDGWSIHRTDDMSGSAFGRECDACHTPHRKSYDDVPALSYGRMLRIYSAQGVVGSALAYSTDTTPFGEKMCYECHGTGTLGVMDSFGGVGTYVAAGGDHQVGYETTGSNGAAHNPDNVRYTTRAARPNGGALPKIACLACHNKHASPIRALVDYRTSDTSTVAYDQAGLCFKCHSAAGAATEIASGLSVGGTNLAWNGRDVKSQFLVTGGGSGSRHPYSAVTQGPQQSQDAMWSQSLQTEFSLDTMVNIDVTTIPDSAQLAASGGGYFGSGSIQAGPIQASGGTLDSWNTLAVNGAAPADTTMTVGLYTSRTGLPPAAPLQSWTYTGPLSIGLGTVPGLLTSDSVYLRADMQAKLVTPTPRVVSDDFNDNVFDTVAPAPAWIDARINGAGDPDAGAANLKTITFATALLDASTGMDALNPSSGNAWTRNTNDGSDGSTAGYARTGTSPSPFTDHIVQKNLGNLSAYASVNISYDWRTSSGTMTGVYYMIAEWLPTGAAPWTTVGNHTASNTTWTPVSMTGLSTGTDCVLRFRAKVADAVNDNVRFDAVVIDAVSAPTNLWPSESGGTLTLRAAGTDFVNQADQGEFVHITDPGWFSGDFDVRVKVNSIQNTNTFAKAGVMIRTGASPLALNATMAGMYVSPGSGVSFQYRTATNVNTAASTTAGQTAPRYLRLVRSGNTVTGHYSTNGTTWTQQGAAQTIPWTGSIYVGMALTSRAAGTFCDAVFDDFSLTEVIGGPVASVTPRLDDWSISYMYTPAPTSPVGRVACVSCHNVHRVKKGGASAWSVDRVSDPANVTAGVTDMTTFCLRCHGNVAVLARSADRTVPYDVLFSTVDTVSASPFFLGWNKAIAGRDFANSAHKTLPLESGKNAYTTCQTCHDPHASANDRLTAWTRPHASPTDIAWVTAPADLDRANSGTEAFEENLCYKCHGSGAAGTSKAPAAPNVYAAATATYRHPIAANGTTPMHSDTEGAAGLGATNRHSECADCHDPHAAKPGIHVVGSSAAGEVLRGSIGIKPTWSATQWTTYTGVAGKTILPGSGDDYEAYLCIKCHSKYSGQPYSVTTGSGTYTSTDLAIEFNPANDSGHNVFGTLTNWPKETVGSFKSAPGNSMTWPTNATFQAGWSKTSKVTCSGCHTYSAGNARGPHGSTVRMLIDSAYSGAWQTAQLGSSTVICNKCHANLDNANDVHSDEDHSGSRDGRCIACHIKVPHGWKRPRLLGYTTDPEPYRSLNLTGITLQNYSGGNWSEDDCGQTGCGEHDDLPSGTKWP